MHCHYDLVRDNRVNRCPQLKLMTNYHPFGSIKLSSLEKDTCMFKQHIRL